MTLVFDNLTKRYGANTAIDGVSTRFEPGTIHGIIGPNGAGKSTLINMTAGSYSVTEGSIRLDDRQLDRMKKYQVANAGIGRTYQNIRLFDQMSVLENLEVCFYDRAKSGIVGEVLWPPMARRRAAERRAICMEYLTFFGLEHMADREAGSLPYGRQRMLEIARALAQDPKVLLLDEPAAGLNHQETAELTERLAALRAPGRIIIVVEHDMDLVMTVCDRITVLHHGKLLFEGTPAEVQASHDVQIAYLGTEHDIEDIRTAAQDRRARLGLRTGRHPQ
ncbi:ATP-binding cassette domain-containing protein [Pseudooceanicola sp. GBMRC 2024]|uniref:ATP-binding cassette domain-containing protein n=1 Tax=Pseudooceanicola albus TaxID=2692189 RepID=A0A6L7G2M0_9RHOB|nr:ABC transporter ATP-binding protein [Pseudooceanicola albus]MXN17942.1 ATP-binding cassette domain-containing protein [Pseudooceanicola albus]